MNQHIPEPAAGVAMNRKEAALSTASIPDNVPHKHTSLQQAIERVGSVCDALEDLLLNVCGQDVNPRPTGDSPMASIVEVLDNGPGQLDQSVALCHEKISAIREKLF